MRGKSGPIIHFLQYCSVAVMWVFSAAITLWVLQLATVAYSLRDAFTASVGITLVALPVYWALAGILTYTFFGLRRGRSSDTPAPGPAPGSVSEPQELTTSRLNM